MQKTIIAAAIIGLVSAGASAVTVYEKDGTKVGLAGKFDFALQKSTSSAVGGNLDSYTILDGKWSTSRLVFSGESAITPDLTAYLGYDLRFDNVFAGKNTNNSTTGTVVSPGGMSSNDAMKGGIVSKKFGKLEAGTINVAAQQFVYKKNYVLTRESEMVKYGVSSMGLESLSNRNIYLSTSPEQPIAAKFSYAFSDESTSRSGKDKGVLYSYGLEGHYNKMIYVGLNSVVKTNNTTETKAGAGNRILHNEGYIAAEKDGYKVDFFMSYDKADLDGKAKKGTGMHLNVYAMVGDKIELAAGIERYKDQSDLTGTPNNDGRGFMLGANYYATKEVSFFAGTRFDNWDREESKASAKIVGTAKDFSGTFDKKFGRQIFTGMNYTF